MESEQALCSTKTLSLSDIALDPIRKSVSPCSTAFPPLQRSEQPLKCLSPYCDKTTTSRSQGVVLLSGSPSGTPSTIRSGGGGCSLANHRVNVQHGSPAFFSPSAVHIFQGEKQGHVAGWCPPASAKKTGFQEEIERPRRDLARENVSLLLWEKEEALWEFCDLGYFCGGPEARCRATAQASADRWQACWLHSLDWRQKRTGAVCTSKNKTDPQMHHTIKKQSLPNKFLK